MDHENDPAQTGSFSRARRRHKTNSAPAAFTDILEPKPPFYLTATFWKRLAVLGSIIFSVASLIMSAIASLRHESAETLRALTISSIVVNSLSISLSALTSLDWKKESTHEKKFAEMLMKVAHVHDGGDVVIPEKEVENLRGS